MYSSLSTVTVNDMVQEDYDVQSPKYCYRDHDVVQEGYDVQFSKYCYRE